MEATHGWALRRGVAGSGKGHAGANPAARSSTTEAMGGVDAIVDDGTGGR